MKTYYFFAICLLFAGLANARVVRNDIWVESRAPLVIRYHERHHAPRPLPASQSRSQLGIDLTLPTEMTAPDLQMEKHSRKGSARYTSLSESFRNDKDEEDLAPRSAKLLNSEDYEDNVCEPQNVRICEHCLKITRAPQAYQECCEDKHNAFSWCKRIYTYSNSQGY